MRKMTKNVILKGKNIFTLRLTNLDLELKGWVSGIGFQIKKNRKIEIKIFKIKRVILVIFFL